jgi:hypothetical protein
LNRYRELKSDLVAAGLALVGTAIAISIWWAGTVPTSLANFIPVSATSSPDLRTALVVVGLFCLTVGVALQHFGGRRSFPFIAASFVLVVLAGLIALRFYSIDLLMAPLLIGGIISVFLVHVNRPGRRIELWLEDC